jgi:hypothetical protein
MNIILHKKAIAPNAVNSQNGTNLYVSIILHKKAIIPNGTSSQNGTNLYVSTILHKKAIATKIHQPFNGSVLMTTLAATYSHKRKLKSQSIKKNAFFRLIF